MDKLVRQIKDMFGLKGIKQTWLAEKFEKRLLYCQLLSL